MNKPIKQRNPPEQVVSSSIKTTFELRDGKPVLLRLPEVNFIDDKEGKPIGIQRRFCISTWKCEIAEHLFGLKR